MSDEADVTPEAGVTPGGDLTLEGEVGTPYAVAETPEGGGFNFTVFGLIVAVVVLVAIQNVWLRRKAERETTEDPS